MRSLTIVVALAAICTLIGCKAQTEGDRAPASAPAPAPAEAPASAKAPDPAPAPAPAPAPIAAVEPQSGPDLKLTAATAAPPVMDGKLDDAVWHQAALFTDFQPRSGETAKGKARLLVAQDSKALYIAVECYEDAETLTKLVADCTERDGAVYKDDSVELFLGPQGAGNYYLIMVNSKGVVTDSFYETPGKSDVTWNAQFPLAANVGKESWVVEMTLPWSIFDRSKTITDTWAFQCQHQRVAGDSERLMFVAFQGSSHQSDKFGRLLGVVGTK